MITVLGGVLSTDYRDGYRLGVKNVKNLHMLLSLSEEIIFEKMVRGMILLYPCD